MTLPGVRFDQAPCESGCAPRLTPDALFHFIDKKGYFLYLVNVRLQVDELDREGRPARQARRKRGAGIALDSAELKFDSYT
jgi:hypothetical protein